MSRNYIVIRDTKEKVGHGWTFTSHENCCGTKKVALKTGDYTIEGLEDVLCLERKGSLTEFANNITQERFEKELVRMDSFKFSFLLLEFTMEDMLDFPYVTGIPKSVRVRTRVRGNFLLRRVMEMQIHHNVKVVFCGKNGQKIASQIFKLVMEKLYEPE